MPQVLAAWAPPRAPHNPKTMGEAMGPAPWLWGRATASFKATASFRATPKANNRNRGRARGSSVWGRVTRGRAIGRFRVRVRDMVTVRVRVRAREGSRV